jgi:hypothetical protein
MSANKTSGERRGAGTIHKGRRSSSSFSLSSSQSLTPVTKRKVSFDEIGMFNNDLDVTSRFLTSQYTTTTSLEDSKNSSYPTADDDDLDNTTRTAGVHWDLDSRTNTVSSSSRKTKSTHDMPVCKHSVTSTLSRLSRSGCLCLLDGDTSAKRRRSITGSAIPSVSEEDMTLDSTLEQVQLDNVHMDDHLVASAVSILSPMSQEVQLQVQVQQNEEKSDRDHDNHSVQPPSYWGHFVDFLSPDPGESKSFKNKRGDSFQRARYRPYHSKTSSSSTKQTFSFTGATDHVQFNDDTFRLSNGTDDEEISRAIERISL